VPIGDAATVVTTVRSVNTIPADEYRHAGGKLCGTPWNSARDLGPITSGQRNWTQGHIAAAHGLFRRIRQMAPMYTPDVIHPFLDPTESGLKRHLDQFSRFCTDHGRQRPCIVQWTAPSPIKIAPSQGYLDPNLIYGSLVPWAHPSPQPKQHLDRFSRFSGITIVTDTTTDNATPSKTIGRVYVRSTDTVVRCGLITFRS